MRIRDESGEFLHRFIVSSKTNICDRVFSDTKSRVSRLDTKDNVRGDDEERKSKVLISSRNNRGVGDREINKIRG